MQEIRRILFIRTDRMGDVLMNLPAIHLLKQTFPEAHLTLMCDASVADLFKGRPSDIDEVMAVESQKIKTSFFYRRELLKAIKKAEYDLAIVSNPDKRLHWLTFLARIPIRVGYQRKWGSLLTKKIPDNKDTGGRHEMDMNLDLVKLVSGVAWDGGLPMAVDPAAAKEIEDHLKRNGLAGQRILAVHPGTSNPTKRWPMERYVELCDVCQAESDLKVVLVGGPEEKEFSKQVKARAKVAPIDWTGSLSLKELAAFLNNKSVKALVSSDSGPVHIAWISGTPVVAFYAKNAIGSNPARWGPRDSRSEVIYKAMDEITSREVFEAVKKVLSK